MKIGRVVFFVIVFIGVAVIGIVVVVVVVLVDVVLEALFRYCFVVDCVLVWT